MHAQTARWCIVVHGKISKLKVLAILIICGVLEITRTTSLPKQLKEFQSLSKHLISYSSIYLTGCWMDVLTTKDALFKPIFKTDLTHCKQQQQKLQMNKGTCVKRFWLHTKYFILRELSNSKSIYLDLMVIYVHITTAFSHSQESRYKNTPLITINNTQLQVFPCNMLDDVRRVTMLIQRYTTNISDGRVNTFVLSFGH